MSRPKAIVPPETHRECSGPCGRTLELTHANFYRSPTCLGGLTRMCRKCAYARKAELRMCFSRERVRSRHNLRPLKEGAICDECFGLPHRVEGQSCWRCGESRHSEPPPDIRDYLFTSAYREVV